MNDQQYPWCILVPKKAGLQEIHQLTTEEQQQFIQESSQVAKCLESLFQADKMNIAALGNMVPQLHIHYVVRYKHDKSWPKPVWGQFAAEPYDKVLLQKRVAQLAAAGLPTDIFYQNHPEGC
ncbi:MAG: HIT family protein [Zetaproteobacteria bacterium]|nr:HIT family protein [Zetaproteobacteria bacterium]